MINLRELNKSPLCSLVDFSGVTTFQVVSKTQEANNFLGKSYGTNLAHPESDALWFYYYQSLKAHYSIHSDEDTTMSRMTPVVLLEVEATAVRMFNYLLRICTRECRHGSGISTLLKNSGYSLPVKDFFSANYGGSSSSSVVRLEGMNDGVYLVEYVKAMVYIFNSCSFSGGYGGKPWANIAKTLYSFVSGETTAEIMVDTGYSLAHNNGPIFNKGMYYKMHSQSLLLSILDCQRAGQIPELILSGLQGNTVVAPSLRAELAATLSEIPSFSQSKVDWMRVMELGAIGNYSSNLTHAQKESLKTPSQLKLEAKVKEEAKKKMTDLAFKKNAKFRFGPDNYVNKISRSELS